MTIIFATSYMVINKLLDVIISMTGKGLYFFRVCPIYQAEIN